MLESLERDRRAVGLLPRRWLRAPLREVFALRDVPVLLALTARRDRRARRGRRLPVCKHERR